jgi:hypothetical protein
MGDLNNYICDKSNKLLDKVELEKLYKQLRLDLTVGDIIWHHDQLSSASENPSAMKLIQDIEAHLFENNKNFTRFLSDYIHGLMSRDVYRNHVFNPDDEPKLSDVEELKTEGWRLLKVFNEPSEDTLIYKKGEIYSGVIYWNESKRQMVLAHRGIDAKFTSYFKEDGTLCTNIEGIIVGKIVPQLAICYDITDQANELASEKGCYLSFTGYANGAWLAEYSNYFSNLYLNNQNTRGVLFESPGIFRDEHEVDSNIVKRGNKFDLCNLNIVNYLTEPCFSNSLNKHVGQAYRLFIYSDEEEEKLKKSLLNNLKKIPLVGEKLKKCKFLLNGLVSMFYHGRLTRIIEKFDSKTGNLKSSEREDSEEILNWPLVKFSLDKKYKGNLKKLSKKPLEKLIKIIPIPSFIKKPAGFIVNEALAWTTDFILEKSIPGLHLIANILIELCSGNIDVTHFENPSFYLRISELRKIKTESSKGPENKNVKEKSKAKVESTEFTLKIKGEYVTIERDEKKQRLLISNSTQNIDWCLDKLESVALDKNNLSKIVYKSLDDLKGLFSTEISLEGNDDKQCKFIIVKESKNEVTIDILKERMIKLLKINPNIRKELKFQMPTSSLVHITHFLNERIPFIGREEIIKKIKEKFEQITTRIVILQAFGGMGKSCYKFKYKLKCFEMRSNLYKGDHPDLSQSLNSLGVSYTRLGDDNKANEFYLKCFKMRSNLYKGDHPDIAQSLNSLGVSYTRLGDDNKALEFDLKCFEMRSNLYKGDHPDLAESLNNLGVSYTRLGDDNKALEYKLKCFKMRSNLYKGDHPDLAESLNNLGVSYTRLGDDNKALEFYLKCFKMRSNLYKGDHPDLAESLNNLGVSYTRLGDDNKALEFYLKCFKMRSNLYKGDHPDLAESLNNLGVSYTRLGDDNKALEFYLKCFEMRSNLYKGDHRDLAESLNSLGVSFERLGDDNKALKYKLKCFEMRSNLYKGDHPDLAQSLFSLGLSYTRLGDDQNANSFNNNYKDMCFRLKQT